MVEALIQGMMEEESLLRLFLNKSNGTSWIYYTEESGKEPLSTPITFDIPLHINTTTKFSICNIGTLKMTA